MRHDLLLPQGSRLIHIGPPKTGTTAVQVAMKAAREDMARQGAYYPKGPYRRRKAGWALGLPGAPRGRTVAMRHWDDLVSEVRDAGDVRVCVSDENFGQAEAPIVSRIVSELGGPEAHVVAVVRRLDKALPSLWQERVKSGHAGDFESWLRRILGDDSADRERWTFWQGHDVRSLADRWTQFVEPERFTLVVADEGDREQLFRVFGEMLGLTAGTLRPSPTRSNVSLSWSELEALRALRAMYDRNGWPTANFGEKLRPVVSALRASPDQAIGPRTPPFPRWAIDRVRALSEERAEAVENLRVRVVGNPQSLSVVEENPHNGSPAGDLALPVGLAVAMVEGMLRAEGALEPRSKAKPLDEVSGRELLRALGARISRRLGSRS